MKIKNRMDSKIDPCRIRLHSLHLIWAASSAPRIPCITYRHHHVSSSPRIVCIPYRPQSTPLIVSIVYTAHRRHRLHPYRLHHVLSAPHHLHLYHLNHVWSAPVLSVPVSSAPVSSVSVSFAPVSSGPVSSAPRIVYSRSVFALLVCTMYRNKSHAPQGQCWVT